MGFIVFSQQPEPRVDFAAIVNQARRYFEASVEVLGESGFDPSAERGQRSPPVMPLPSQTRARLSLSSARHGYSGSFTVVARPATAADLARAREAEVRGNAAGMALLAERCPTVWEVETEQAGAEAATLNLLAVLASAALGPVLPPDASTLFGVRGAMERLERLVGRSLAR